MKGRGPYPSWSSRRACHEIVVEYHQQSLVPSSALRGHGAAPNRDTTVCLFQLKCKDRRKLRSNVMRREARNPAKQWQQSCAKIRARAVVTLLVGERHPLIPLVLNVA